MKKIKGKNTTLYLSAEAQKKLNELQRQWSKLGLDQDTFPTFASFLNIGIDQFSKQLKKISKKDVN